MHETMPDDWNFHKLFSGDSEKTYLLSTPTGWERNVDSKFGMTFNFLIEKYVSM